MDLERKKKHILRFEPLTQGMAISRGQCLNQLRYSSIVTNFTYQYKKINLKLLFFVVQTICFNISHLDAFFFVDWRNLRHKIFVWTFIWNILWRGVITPLFFVLFYLIGEDPSGVENRSKRTRVSILLFQKILFWKIVAL